MNAVVIDRQATKTSSYATKLMITYKHPMDGLPATDYIWCEGKTIAQAHAAAKAEEAKQHGIPGTIKCWTAGTFPVTKPLRG